MRSPNTFLIHRQHIDALKTELANVAKHIRKFKLCYTNDTNDTNVLKKEYVISNAYLTRRGLKTVTLEIHHKPKSEFVHVSHKVWKHGVRKLRLQVKLLNRLIRLNCLKKSTLKKLTTNLSETYATITSNHHIVDTKGNLVIANYRELNRYNLTPGTILGKGTYGQVVHAIDSVTQCPVAIKVLKKARVYVQQSIVEKKILSVLNMFDVPNTVRMHDAFSFMGHPCIVFNLLSMSLLQLLELTRYRGVSLNLIRKFARQLCTTLNHLKHGLPVGIIHGDLKPENILLCDPKRSAISIIDFGSACFANETVQTYIQSRYYRAPEVIVRAPYSFPIDMWSVGCILVEMHTGSPLFGGRDEMDMMEKMVGILGQPDDSVLANGKQTKKYFPHIYTANRHIAYPSLKTIVEGPLPVRTTCDIIGHTTEDYALFLDMIQRMLDWSPETRMTPAEALCHPFLT